MRVCCDGSEAWWVVPQQQILVDIPRRDVIIKVV
jgi:hypothetical protein